MFAEAPFLRTTDLKHVEITSKHVIMIWSILQSFKAQLAWTLWISPLKHDAFNWKFKELHTSKESRVKAPLFSPHFHTWFQTAVDICWSAWCDGADNSAQVLAARNLSTYDLKAWAQQNHTLHSTVSSYKKTNVQRDLTETVIWTYNKSISLISDRHLLSRPNPDKIFPCRQMYNRTCSLLEWDSLITVCELWGLPDLCTISQYALFLSESCVCVCVCVCVCSDNPAV